MKELYCLKCKKVTPNVKSVIVKLPNGRFMARSSCKICGSQKAQFISTPSKGGNPAMAIAQGIEGGIKGLSSAVDTGVRAQHDFNKDNGALKAEQEKNFQKYYRDLIHTRYWDPTSLSTAIRLKKFGIDPPNVTAEGSSWLKSPSNQEKLDKADDALLAYAEKKYYGSLNKF